MTQPTPPPGIASDNVNHCHKQINAIMSELLQHGDFSAVVVDDGFMVMLETKIGNGGFIVPWTLFYSKVGVRTHVVMQLARAIEKIAVAHFCKG